MSSTKTPRSFFITSTDTGVGKTTVTALLIKQLQSLGYSAVGCKPVAAGSINTNKGLRHQDALVYQNINSIPLDYEKINPVLFNQPISPNIAAITEEKKVTVEDLTNSLSEILTLDCDYIFFEGVGGWRVPLNEESTMADLARTMNLPVILVVGIKLGCLNHSLLTWEALHRDNMNIAGWIANIIEPDTLEIQHNIATLKKWINAPCLGEIGYKESESKLNDIWNLSALLNSEDSEEALCEVLCT